MFDKNFKEKIALAKEKLQLSQKALTNEEVFDLKKRQMLLRVNQITANKITAGFQSRCSGELVTYDSDIETQLTVSSDLNTISLAPEQFAEHYPEGYPMRGYPKGKTEKVLYRLSFEQLIQWNVDLALHRGECKQWGWEKQDEVKACTTVEELDDVVL